MASPIAPKPSEFAAVVVESTDTIAVAFVKVFIRFPVLLYRWYLSWYNPDGTPTIEFKAKLCAAWADCPEDTST
jgi:hypothetical protein